jgi:hypothetical protein
MRTLTVAVEVDILYIECRMYRVSYVSSVVCIECRMYRVSYESSVVCIECRMYRVSYESNERTYKDAAEYSIETLKAYSVLWKCRRAHNC